MGAVLVAAPLPPGGYVSPTVLRTEGYLFIIFFNDHTPPHVHVKRAGNAARVRLDPVEELHNRGFNTREMGKILTIVEANQALLLAAWKEIYGE